MPLASGAKLGPYEIVGLIGAGGMGEVYRARDSRLGRDVALKVLPAELAGDPSRLHRFELEARAVAALSHPNIVAVFDIGCDNNISYIVSELVEGESLRRSRVGLRKALDLAVQIAGGLATAHEAGIVHRDLKPENILLTRDGRAKILDFGLAKMRGEKAAATAATQTLTVDTEPGVVMGTVGYMSPEQVRGAEVDHRSDIFSFGAVLHELLSGKRAFEGETKIDIMQAVLRQEPAGLPPTVPPGVHQIVSHCLEKDPANRFQSARDLSFALAALTSGSGSSAKIQAAPQRLPWIRRGPAIALAGLVLLALGLGIGRFWSTPGAPVWTGTRLGGPEYAMGPRISPDGKALAFLAFIGTLTQVAVMKPETGNWIVLTRDTANGSVGTISWSVDGSRIFYDRRTDVPRGIFSVPALGGDEHLVLPDAGGPEALPDGSLLFLRNNPAGIRQLFRFRPESGAVEPYPVQVANGVLLPQIRAFDDGRKAIVYGGPIGSPTKIGEVLVDLASKETRVLAEGASLTGALAAARDGESILDAARFGDLVTVRSRRANGNAPPRTLFTLSVNANRLDSAPDGSIYADQFDRPVALVRISPAGSQKIADLPFSIGPTVFLPDGRALIMESRFGRFKVMIWQSGKELVPAANTADDTSVPATLLAGNQAAFLTLNPAIRPLRGQIAIADLATGAILRRITPQEGFISHLAATPDGKTLYFASAGFIWSVPSAGGEPVKLRPRQSVAADPNGMFLLVTIPADKRVRLLRVPLNGGPDQEIHIPEPYSFSDLNFSSYNISRSGRVLVSLIQPDSWFYSPAVIDLATGRLTRIPADPHTDYLWMGWAPNGDIIAATLGLRAELWRFQPQGR